LFCFLFSLKGQPEIVSQVYLILPDRMAGQLQNQETGGLGLLPHTASGPQATFFLPLTVLQDCDYRHSGFRTANLECLNANTIILCKLEYLSLRARAHDFCSLQGHCFQAVIVKYTQAQELPPPYILKGIYLYN
jgi:hypothetical protein